MLFRSNDTATTEIYTVPYTFPYTTLFRSPLAAIELAEAIATSDVPGGVVNLLTGSNAELGPWLASHMDVNAIDLCGVPAGLVADLAAAAAGNLKRVVRPRDKDGAGDDWTAAPSLNRMLTYLETKTVWHPAST